jgi:uncharacterized protein YaiL (DUF2058 family)
MKKTIIVAAGICIASASMTSCIVSKKKFDAETARAEKEKAEKIALGKRLDDQLDQNKKLNAANAELKNNITSLNGRIARLTDSIGTLEG